MERTPTLHGRKTAGDVNDRDATWYIDHQSGRMSVKPFAGFVLLDDDGQVTDVPPERLTIPTEFAVREPFIELVGHRTQPRPGGPPEDPWRMTHSFPQADEIIVHTLSADLRYRVTRQPDKYDADGNPTDAVPTVDARYEFEAELVDVTEPTGWSRKGAHRLVGYTKSGDDLVPYFEQVEA